MDVLRRVYNARGVAYDAMSMMFDVLQRTPLMFAGSKARSSFRAKQYK